MRSITLGLVLVLSACGSSSDDTAGGDATLPGNSGGSAGSAGGGSQEDSGIASGQDSGPVVDATTNTQDAIATVVGSCNDFPAAGTWQNITPPQLKLATWCTPQWNAVCPAPEATNDAGKLGTSRHQRLRARPEPRGHGLPWHFVARNLEVDRLRIHMGSHQHRPERDASRQGAQLDDGDAIRPTPRRSIRLPVTGKVGSTSRPMAASIGRRFYPRTSWI